MAILKEIISFLTYGVNSLGVSLNLMVDIIPFTFSFIFLKDSENELVVPAFALLLSCFIYFYGYLVSFQETVSLRCAPHYSSQTPSEFSKMFYKMGLINLLFLTLSVILVISSKKLLIVANIKEELAEIICLVLLKTLPAKIIENISNLIKGLLMATNNFKVFHIINFLTSISFFLGIYVFIKKYQLELDGFAIAMTIKSIVELIALSIIVIWKINKKYLSLSQWRSFAEDFLSELYFVLSIVLSNYFEVVSFFLSTLILAQTKDETIITGFTIYVDMTMYVYYLQQGCYSYIRTQLLIEIGKKDRQQYIKQKRRFLFYVAITSLFASIAWYFSFEYLADIYTKNHSIAEQIKIVSFTHLPGISTDFLCLYSLVY